MAHVFAKGQKVAKVVGVTAATAMTVAAAGAGLSPIEGQPQVMEHARKTSPIRGLLGATADILDTVAESQKNRPDLTKRSKPPRTSQHPPQRQRRKK